MPSTLLWRRWKPMTSQSVPRSLPRVPRGMSGLTSRVAASNCWRMARLGSLASRMEWQLPHPTVAAWPNERSVMAAPHFGQFNAFACGFGGPESGGVAALSPALETAQIFQFKIFEFHEFTEIESRLRIAVIERSEFSGLRAQIDEGDVRLVPILKRQFAFDAAIMCGRDHAHDIALIAPGELLADVDLRGGGKIRRFRSQRQRVFTLRVGAPCACAVVHHDVPLIPAALIVFIKDAANHNERLVAVFAFGIDLNGRAVRREIGDLAYFFQVHILADEHTFSKFAYGLHAAGPAKNDLGTTVRTIGNWLGHRESPTGFAARRFTSVTGDLLPFGFVGPRQPTARNRIRIKELPQNRFEIPFGARNAAEKIQAERAVLRKRVTGEVRLREKAEAGDASGAGTLMPLRFADGPELHLPDDAVEQVLQDSRVTQRLRGTSEGFDDPLDSAHGRRRHYTWGFPHSGQNLALRGMGLPHSLQNLVSAAGVPA